ncbi:MAG: hypothetical protein OXU20_28505 [Myxococcales bacterium]|nr:hypothetical protein [Myxococcales bacterium]
MKRILGIGSLIAFLHMAACAKKAPEAEAETETSGQPAENSEPKGADEAPAPNRTGPFEMEMLMSAAYGSDPGQLGTGGGDESTPEGPSSFAVGRNGELFVLDPVNSRVQVYADGAPTGTFPLPTDQIQDIALLPNGNLVLLDRHKARKLYAVNASGEPQGELAYDGKHLSSDYLTDTMRIGDDGVWLMAGRDRFVRVADAEFKPDPARPVSHGVPSRDGELMLGVSLAGVTVNVTVRPRTGVPRNRTTNIAFDNTVTGLYGVETDSAGNIYLFVDHLAPDEDPGAVRPRIVGKLVVLSPDLKPIRESELPVQQAPHSVLRAAVVTAGGDVYHFDAAEKQVGIRRYR